MKTEFFMPMIPPTCTHQEHQVAVIKGKPHFYEPAELKAARSMLEAHLAPYAPKEKYAGALRVVVKWLFPIKGTHVDGEWKTSPPDTHNLDKLLFDVMTGLCFWKDDALVASEIIEKFWADKPGIYICITEI